MRSLQRKIKPCYRLLNKAVAHHNKPVNALTLTGFVRLMADCQTTGGYPKIAQVIQADLPRLAQMPPRAPLQFELVILFVRHLQQWLLGDFARAKINKYHIK